LADIHLNRGDASLIQGPEERIAQLQRNKDFLILDTPPMDSKRTKKDPQAVLILNRVFDIDLNISYLTRYFLS